MMNVVQISINDLFGEDVTDSLADLLASLQDVELIVGKDTTTKQVFTIYGQKRLDQIMADPNAPSVDVLAIELEEQSDELERILALVQMSKGRYDYVPKEMRQFRRLA